MFLRREGKLSPPTKNKCRIPYYTTAKRKRKQGRKNKQTE
jgi:hypothetical protein